MSSITNSSKLDFTLSPPSLVSSVSGCHQAFTGMCRFGDRLFLVFRRADNHMSYDGRIAVLVSDDGGKNWRECACITAADGDLRDPKICVFNQQLMIIAGCRIPIPPDGNRWHTESRRFVSVDGVCFSPAPLTGMLPETFIWQATPSPDGHHLYGSGYSRVAGQPLLAAFYDSVDGENWRCRFQLPFESGNEMTLDFDCAGELWGLLRMENRPGWPVLLHWPHPDDCSAEPEAREIPLPMQGMMLKCIGQEKLVFARRWNEPPAPRLPRMELLRLRDDAAPELIATLPSGGDCSYASWASLGENRGLVAYYSSHRYLDENGRPLPETGRCADIFTTELTWRHQIG